MPAEKWRPKHEMEPTREYVTLILCIYDHRQVLVGLDISSLLTCNLLLKLISYLLLIPKKKLDHRQVIP